MNSMFGTQTPGAQASTSTQADHTDQAGVERSGYVSMLSSGSDDDDMLFNQFVKLPDEEGGTSSMQVSQAQQNDNSEEGDTSFGSSNEDSAVGTASIIGGSEGTGGSEVVDREAAIAEIREMLGMWPEITLALIDFTEPFTGTGEEAEMLTRSSTIVDARHDHEAAFIEFTRGVDAICRVVSDERLHVLHDWAVQLKAEWIEAIAKDKEARYPDYVDLMYSEATSILEKGTGDFRGEEDLEVLSEVFGFVVKEA